MDVLLIQDQEEVRERVLFALESQYQAKVTEAPTVQAALQALKERGDSKFNLILFDYTAAQAIDLGSLWPLCSGIPLIVCAPSKDAPAPVIPESHGAAVHVVSRAEILENLFDTLDKMETGGEIRRGAAAESEYVRIRTKLLLSVSPLKADIYIRLSSVKYIKLFQEGDVFDRGDLEKYTHKKGIQYLFLKTSECGEFIDRYRKELENLLAARQLPPEKTAAALEEGIETVQQLMHRVGFTPEVQELAKTQVQIMMKSVVRSPTLGMLFKKLQSHEGKYISSHSVMTAHVACAIASLMHWGSDTTYHKLNLAAYFHDISLNDDDLAQFESLEELQQAKDRFSPEAIREYKFHTIKAAEMIKKMSELPPDVDTIILQHHERPEGGGFPRGLTHTHIAPLASLFIIAHDMVKEMIKHKANFSMQDYLQLAQSKFQSGVHFKKILRAMAGADFQTE